jgi:hypothetical protein
MIINYSFDSSVTKLNIAGDPSYDPALYVAFTGAVQAAVQYFDSTIINPITVSINFGWGEVDDSPIIPGAVSQSSSFQFGTDYTMLRQALQVVNTGTAVQRAAIASLPATDPANGAAFAISTAEAAVLGLYVGPASEIGGSVGLDNSAEVAWSWTQSTVAPNTFDAIAALEHEISEILGRQATGGAGGSYNVLDLYRYTASDGVSPAVSGSAAGIRDEPFMAGYDANAASYFSYDGTKITLPFETPGNVADGADVADWAPSVSNDAFADGGPDGIDSVSPTDLQTMEVLGYDVACFLPGTRIATPTGEITVEHLGIGDLVLTLRGDAKPVIWIGVGNVLVPRGGRSAATPVTVRRDALSENVPNRDLRLTKGHSLYIDNVLIPVEFLINHRSIQWDDQAREVTFYHIELAVHDVLLANGTPTESYRDDGNRWMFRNDNISWDQTAKPPCAPVLTGGQVVDEVWDRLLRRAGPLPSLPLTSDPDLHLQIAGSRIKGRQRPQGVYAFRIPKMPPSVHIVSRAAAQDKLGLARDPRMLGVALRRIVIWEGQKATVIEADDERLREGFHAYEAIDGIRWTDGNAGLSGRLFDMVEGPCSIDIYVAGTTWYPLLQEHSSAA